MLKMGGVFASPFLFCTFAKEKITMEKVSIVKKQVAMSFDEVYKKWVQFNKEREPVMYLPLEDYLKINYKFIKI